MSSTTNAGPAVSAGPAHAGPAPARRRKSNWGKRLEIGLFAGPALVVYLTFVLVPVALAAVYSFFNWNGFGPLVNFIGIDNYTRALSDPVFLGAIRNNLFVV